MTALDVRVLKNHGIMSDIFNIKKEIYYSGTKLPIPQTSFQNTKKKIKKDKIETKPKDGSDMNGIHTNITKSNKKLNFTNNYISNLIKLSNCKLKTLKNRLKYTDKSKTINTRTSFYTNADLCILDLVPNSNDFASVHTFRTKIANESNTSYPPYIPNNSPTLSTNTIEKKYENNNNSNTDNSLSPSKHLQNTNIQEITSQGSLNNKSKNSNSSTSSTKSLSSMISLSSDSNSETLVESIENILLKVNEPEEEDDSKLEEIKGVWGEQDNQQKTLSEETEVGEGCETSLNIEKCVEKMSIKEIDVEKNDEKDNNEQEIINRIYKISTNKLNDSWKRNNSSLLQKVLVKAISKKVYLYQTQSFQKSYKYGSKSGQGIIPIYKSPTLSPPLSPPLSWYDKYPQTLIRRKDKQNLALSHTKVYSTTKSQLRPTTENNNEEKYMDMVLEKTFYNNYENLGKRIPRTSRYLKRK
ncbi:hypothetical protein BB559_004624 [Furculomyces boomerangus]|uniref:Uncharacterized protein n=1 Tax=Furculomyces boomerangus TaxID=61424 RepID=A0A2T9YDP5_9FUNG|nr:hypothetical protein BB559_004624 [Furculomyces boomerangus]